MAIAILSKSQRAKSSARTFSNSAGIHNGACRARIPRRDQVSPSRRNARAATSCSCFWQKERDGTASQWSRVKLGRLSHRRRLSPRHYVVASPAPGFSRHQNQANQTTFAYVVSKNRRRSHALLAEAGVSVLQAGRQNMALCASLCWSHGSALRAISKKRHRPETLSEPL